MSRPGRPKAAHLADRHRGRGGVGRPRPPATPPGMRVRTGRFDRLRWTCRPSPRCSCPGSAVDASARKPVVAASPLRPILRPSLTLSFCDMASSRTVVVSPFLSFGPSPRRSLDVATTASADFSLRRPRDRRRPFRRKARSPRVRTQTFAARPPDLRRLALVTRASRSSARSPCSAPPDIRFLFVGPQLRSPLPSRRPRGSTLCGLLRSL